MTDLESERAERATEAPNAGWLLAALFFPVPFVVAALITIPAYERDGYARTASMLRTMVRVIAIILAVIAAAAAARLAR